MSSLDCVDMKNSCRSCMGTSTNMRPLISQMDGDGRTLLEVLLFVTGIEITHDENYPNQICEDCILNIRIADGLKMKCEKTQEILASSLAKIKNKTWSEDESILCGKCNIKFRSSAKYINHEQCHENPYQCSICLVKYSKFQLLESHLNTTHNKVEGRVKKFECDSCGQIFSSNDDVFQTHVKDCTESKLYNEDYMNYSNDGISNDDYVDRKIDIDAFELKVNPKQQINSGACTFCLEIFDTKKALKQHIKSTHSKTRVLRKKRLKSKKNKANSTPSLELNSKNETSEISKTEKVYVKSEKSNDSDENSTQLLSKTASKKVPYSCMMCEEKFSKKYEYVRHLKTHKSKSTTTFNCNFCKREFIHKAHLEKHVLSNHNSEGSFKCSICSLNFATQDLLNIHINTHKDSKKHKCEFCDKGFNMLSTLKDHARTHTGEKPYLCSTCGRGFSQKTNLKEHMRRHMGFKPFACNLCDQKFVSKGELQAHLRKHTGAHPFICTVCDAKFTTSSSLVKHRRIHTGERPYICEHCSMRFSTLGTLKNHRRTHTGEKPYKCTFCEKAFAQRNDLTTHIRCHTGERPYVCPTCGQAFKQSSALKTHQKLHAIKDGEPIQLMMKKKFYVAMEPTTSISPDLTSSASLPENNT